MRPFPGPDVAAPPPERTAPLSAWFWLLPVAALFAWWPLEPFWASDDFFALHYARDLDRALEDFANPQYGASDIWYFYRPLITLSFWFDNAVADGSAFFCLLENALFHAASALLVALIWRRFLPDAAAVAAGLLWAAAPGQAGSILWAVGRVDSHTTLWCLLSLWAFCRFREGRRPMLALSLLAFALGLGSKELAFCVPGLVFALGFALQREAGFAARLRAGVVNCLPHVLLFGGYLALRHAALGRLVGGYDSAQLAWSAMPAGLGSTVLDLLAPLRYSGQRVVEEQLGAVPATVLLVCYLPAILSLVMIAWERRWALLAVALPAFVVACVPMLPFWSQPNPHNLRYYYLPFALLAGILAAGGPLVWAVALLTWAPAFLEVRQDYGTAHREMAAMHRSLLRESRELDGEGAMFVAGLPHATPDGLVVQYHFGVDRILLPPFGPGRHRVLALRPIVEVPGVFRLEDDPPSALPGHPTFFFEDPTILGMAPESALPELAVELVGMPDFHASTMRRLAARELEAGLRMPGHRAEAYRITVFTATGYLATVVPDHGPAGAADGTVDLYRLFVEGRYALQGDHYLLRGLEVPTVLDLDLRFPVLVEAGQMVGAAFAPTHRARRLLEFEFDRGFTAFVREVLGL